MRREQHEPRERRGSGSETSSGSGSGASSGSGSGTSSGSSGSVGGSGNQGMADAGPTPNDCPNNCSGICCLSERGRCGARGRVPPPQRPADRCRRPRVRGRWGCNTGETCALPAAAHHSGQLGVRNVLSYGKARMWRSRKDNMDLSGRRRWLGLPSDPGGSAFHGNTDAKDGSRCPRDRLAGPASGAARTVHVVPCGSATSWLSRRTGRYARRAGRSGGAAAGNAARLAGVAVPAAAHSRAPAPVGQAAAVAAHVPCTTPPTFERQQIPLQLLGQSLGVGPASAMPWLPLPPTLPLLPLLFRFRSRYWLRFRSRCWFRCRLPRRSRGSCCSRRMPPRAPDRRCQDKDLYVFHEKSLLLIGRPRPEGPGRVPSASSSFLGLLCFNHPLRSRRNSTQLGHEHPGGNRHIEGADSPAARDGHHGVALRPNNARPGPRAHCP